MLFVIVAVLPFVCSASPAPSRQKRFDVFDPLSFGYAYARPFGAYSGAYAGGYPFYNPFMMNPFPFFSIPMPDLSKMKPWYEGPNVCKDEKVMDEPDIVKELLGDFNFGSDFLSYKQSAMTCKGMNGKVACIKRMESNGASKIQVTKYQCCDGFVVSPDGQGCAENPTQKVQSKEVTTESSIPSPVKMSGQFKYNIFKGNSKMRSGVENVPAQ